MLDRVENVIKIIKQESAWQNYHYYKCANYYAAEY